ncbi:hypothetical protein [Leifsonia sp. 2MCAF36]|uniref:hypothetical protein n=1 Tax=Leifsonia sp. 2MCAF36 TaxID=3232988 RepID=UPI003F9D010C
MSDERGRGAEDDGRPQSPDESTEPEFGSSDWLLQQLTGGRQVQSTGEQPTVEQPTVEQPTALQPTVALPVVAPEEPDAGRFDDLLRKEDQAAPAEPEPSQFPVAFSWNLTPGEGADPLVAPEPEPEPEPEPAAVEPTPLREPDAVAGESASVVAPEPAPLVPPVYRSPFPEPAAAPRQVEPSGVDSESATGESATGELVDDAQVDDARVDEEQVDEAPVDATPVAARSWVIESPPVPAAEPEPPRTIFDAPAAPAPEPESHGLAALLGFGDHGAPSGRSIIGDTTSIIPIVPAALTPPAADGSGTAEPGPPVLPPIDAAALMEQPPAGATPEVPAQSAPTQDVPTQQLDAAEMAALLRAGRDRSAPVLPSEPAIPAAEAELALGGMPSPATSPIDAESIAGASEAEPLDTAPSAATEDTVGAEDDSDGLAALFGDVAVAEPVEPDTEPEPEPEPEPDLEPEPEPDPEPRPAPAWEQTAAWTSPPEAAADLEGPQLPETSPFAVPRRTPEPPATDPYGQGSPPRFTPLATAATPTAAAVAASGAIAGTPAAVPAGTPAGPGGPTPPGGPGIWGSRNNRILLIAVAALAVVLVLIGLFALGTRIPSLLGAPKAAPQPTTSAPPRSATPSPTPTPVPTVTPKPAAAVGAGSHPWDALGGGECIQPFTSVWAQDFTVVDCTASHTAQLVYTNVLSADPAAPYPGADALAQQIPGLCTASGVVDLKAAGAYPDLQVVGSFPATERQWKDGQRSYYCFANRSSGQPLTSSVAGPGPGA